jgi:two-component system sensor histidine kinase AtoS
MSKQLSDHLNDKQKRLMAAILDESLRINRIFSGILNFAHMSSIRSEEIVLERFFDDVLLLLQHHEAYLPTVKINALYKGKDIKIKADPEQIKEACLNIITNAYEAMKNGGTLTVDCEKNHNYVTISISDSGNGIDPKISNDLFTPFKTTKLSGTGLGLAQANKIVGQHNGRIEVTSKRGKGTRVNIILPLQI